MPNSTKRFRVAFSFAGEKRDYVHHMASLLAAKFAREAVLYDKFHESEFANWKLGLKLPALYHDQSDLIVVIVCPDYNTKEWCGLEWMAIHDLLKSEKSDDVMLCRFGYARVDGIYGNSGFMELDHKTAEDAVALILERLALNEGRPRDHYRDADKRTVDAHSIPETPTIPTAPAFYAEPSYIGSHDFVGRRAELETLSDWASPADSHPILLFEAIGGSGKSMLTWEWTTKHAPKVDGEWAGTFWYSFYEKGAVMVDFCQRALAYVTGRPLESFKGQKTSDLGEQLVRELQTRRWLLILDGLERVLVAYHSIDAAQFTDEHVNSPRDEVAHRDPCSAICPEDDALLKRLAQTNPSKILITTRLTPRILVNRGGLSVPGVMRTLLTGLRPADAEELLTSSGVRGTSAKIQAFLKTHCDCHPLVTGALAGLINDYLPDRGNFDTWLDHVDQVDFSQLDLIQSRNHILRAAIDAVPAEGRHLLSTLALLSEAADYSMLCAVNPHIPPEPQPVEEPESPSQDYWWNSTSERDQKELWGDYERRLERWKEYQREIREWQEALSAATRAMSQTVLDLERRGLLQYDRQSKRYDLHPVVRGVTASGLAPSDKDRYGQRVIDYCSRQSDKPYQQAQTLEDMRYGLRLVSTLLRMGRLQQACDAYLGVLCNPLLFTLEAYSVVLAISKPYFPLGWNQIPTCVSTSQAVHLASDAAMALQGTGEIQEALDLEGAVIVHSLKQDDWYDVRNALVGIANCLNSTGRLAKLTAIIRTALDIATLEGAPSQLFKSRRDDCRRLMICGHYKEAEATWELLSSGDAGYQNDYHLGSSKVLYLELQDAQGKLTEHLLSEAESWVRDHTQRVVTKELHELRGKWHLEQGQWSLAVASLHEAVRMARESGQSGGKSEARLCLAQYHLGQLSDPLEEAENLSNVKSPSHNELADLWLAIGDYDKAKEHALAGYKEAWADGEPYCYRDHLNRAIAMLDRLGEPVPTLPPYDPSKDPKFAWEDELHVAIEIFRAEKSSERYRIANDDFSYGDPDWADAEK